MKKCQQCGFESDDSMRFCLNCGAPLSSAPIVINLHAGGSGAQKQSEINTASYGKSAETHVGGQSYPTHFSAPPTKRGGGGGKVLAILGGLFALFLLFSVAAGAIAYFVLVPEPKPLVDNDTPTPTPTRTASPKSPTPTPTPSPSLTPTATSTPFPSVSPTQQGTTTTATKNKVERMWVDWNVRENNRLGMRVHVKFWVYDLEGVDTYLAVYFQKKNGNRLLTNNSQYASKDGQVALFKLLRPAYDPAVYEDVQVFMPYDELNLQRGRHDLQMDVDLIYKEGGMIQHLYLYDFWYEQK